MKERVRGMVLSSATIGECDKRLVLLTRERGRITAFARGARRPRSALAASTEPFTFGEFYIYRGRESYSVEQVEVKNYFPELRKDLESLYMALYFCEVADYFTREGMGAVDELNLLYLSLRALSVPSIPARLVRGIYEVRFLSIEGEAPRMFECSRCGGAGRLRYFFVREAGIVCEGCYSGLPPASRGGGIALSDTTVYTLQRILASPVEKLYTFTVGGTVLDEFGEVSGRYFRSRTDREFKSAHVMDW